MPAPSPARSLLYSKHTVDLPTLLEVVRLLVDRVEHLEQELARERDEVVMQPGAAAVDFAYHQDCRFRRPPAAYRNLADSYIQLGIAIDPHTPQSGAMRIYPGSHRLGDLGLGDERPIMHQEALEEPLHAVGLDPTHLVDLVLEPGDVAMWSPFLVHGSGANRTARDRRLYINGYVRAVDCDRLELRRTFLVPGPRADVVRGHDVEAAGHTVHDERGGERHPVVPEREQQHTARDGPGAEPGHLGQRHGPGADRFHVRMVAQAGGIARAVRYVHTTWTPPRTLPPVSGAFSARPASRSSSRPCCT